MNNTRIVEMVDGAEKLVDDEGQLFVAEPGLSFIRREGHVYFFFWRTECKL